jgi:hypothetical protein
MLRETGSAIGFIKKPDDHFTRSLLGTARNANRGGSFGPEPERVAGADAETASAAQRPQRVQMNSNGRARLSAIALPER